MTEPAAQAQTTPAPQPRERATWDIVLTIVFLVVSVGVNALGSYLGVMLAFASDSCSTVTPCNYDQISAGMLIAIFGPWVGFVVVTSCSIILLVKRRRAFWVPLVGTALTVALVGVGIALVFNAANVH